MTRNFDRNLLSPLQRFFSCFPALTLLLLCAPLMQAQATWSPIVKVGPGYVDCYTRQVVRTAGDVVYVVTNASGFSGGTALSSIRMYKGSPAGNPTSQQRALRRSGSQTCRG
jgi:hypothetical protein